MLEGEGRYTPEEARTSKDREQVNKVYENAKHYLSKYFGVGELTIIEASHLRRIVNETLRDASSEKVKLAKSSFPEYNMILDLEVEAGDRWLHDLYGIDWADVPKTTVIKDISDGKEYAFTDSRHGDEYESPNDVKQEELRGQLGKQGHTLRTEFLDVSDDFKSHLRILREKAHNP